MRPAGNEEAFVLRTLGDLIARGEALIQARRNPVTGGKMFADFGEAYRGWYAAGKELIAGLCGSSEAKEWSIGQCRAMYSLEQGTAFALKEQERQQAMLVKLRARLGSYLAKSAEPGASGSAERSGKPAQAVASDTDKAESPPERAHEGLDRLYAMKRLGRDLKDEELLEDLRQAAKAVGKTTITAGEYQLQRRFALKSFLGRFGSWNNALAAAGLAVGSPKNIPTEELFENLARVWQAVGRQPVETDMVKPQSKFSYAPYGDRFGGWLRALKAFVAWVREGKTPEEGSASRSPASPEKSRHPNARLRFAVLQRDSFKCTACGRSPATDPGVKLHVDHKVPWSRGGRTTLDNLATLCERCNLGKSNADFGMPTHPS